MDRWKAIRLPSANDSKVDPEHTVLLKYLSNGRPAVVALNRPQANNAIKTEDGVRVTESLEKIAARTSVRAVIVTGQRERSERRRQLQVSKQS